MLKNKKRVRADSGEIIEQVVPLPPRAQPARPVEYVLFQPTPALPESQTQGTKEPGMADSEAIPEEDEKTRVCVQRLYLLMRYSHTCTESKAH